MEPMNLAEHKFDLIFGFVGEKSWRPVPLDPKFGHFRAKNLTLDQTRTQVSDISIVERDLFNEEDGV